jgi:hypothetical protein
MPLTIYIFNGYAGVSITLDTAIILSPDDTIVESKVLYQGLGYFHQCLPRPVHGKF